MSARRRFLALAAVAALCGAALHAPAAWPEPVRSERFMVATPDPLATEVGASVLRRGGNAVDAAVAVALTLAVTYPRSGNLGGGGFLLYREAATGKAVALDFRETAPAAAEAGMFLDEEGRPRPRLSLEGRLAAGVPGTVAGLVEAHRRWGSLPWKELVAPAVELAEDGFPVSRFLSRSLAGAREGLARDPEASAIFLLPDGSAPPPGHRLRQQDLARTLRRIAARKADGFYRGPVSRALARDMAEGGGLITARDLATYRPAVREPLVGAYRSHRILTMPPPSSGGIALLQALRMLEAHAPRELGLHSSAMVHLLAEIERRIFADRAVHLGDPDFVDVPVEGLLARAYVDGRAAEIDPAAATPSERMGAGDPWAFQPGDGPGGRAADRAESSETNHVSVVDGAGNAVALTTTLNSNFGAMVVARGTGVLLNNQMDDFSTAPGVPNQYGLVGGEANGIAPGKRMLSSMTPTIVEKDGHLVLVAGSPGGSTIISTLIQLVVNTVDFELDPMAAVCAPRVHHQWLPDEIRVEPGALSADTLANLKSRGHRVVERPPMGSANVVGRDPESGEWLGAADPRRAGSARGD